MSANNRSVATLWVLGTCLRAGLIHLMVILITASSSSKMYNIALLWEGFTFEETKSTLYNSECFWGSWVLHCVFRWFTGFSVLCLNFCFWFAFGLSSEGIPSLRRPAAREVISDRVDLCDTHVCFLHIQLKGTNVWLPNMHSAPLEVDLEFREIRHQLSLRTEPRETHCREVSNETASQFWGHVIQECREVSCFVRKAETNMELVGPLTSLCCLAPVLRCILCGDQTRPSVGFPLYPFWGTQFLCGEQKRPWACVRSRHSGVVLFFPAVAGMFLQGSAGRCLSVVSCLSPFALRARCLFVSLRTWCETATLKVNTLVGEFRQCQVVIWNPSLAWETRSRRVNRVCWETSTMHASWLKVSRSKRSGELCLPSLVWEKHTVGVSFCPCTHIHPRACCCVTWLCGSILSRYFLAVLSVLSWYSDECTTE